MTGPLPITISLHALGGQGGGVLGDWLVALGRARGWLTQSTSVPGVAQRTGATVYYIEIFPAPHDPDREPVLALMPTPGDVDLVIAAELMEAGRAVNRGLGTSDRTTLVTSTSRVYAISEKSARGDGRFDPDKVMVAARASARRFVAADLEAAAARTDSVISATLFGAVAASGALPFERQEFEEAIREAGIAVKTNLAGFSAGFEAAIAAESLWTGSATKEVERPRAVRTVIQEGVRRLNDYQDRAYADLYLRRLNRLAEVERADGQLSQEVARYLALWMSYEDTIRVADLKVRPERFDRVRAEVGAADGQIVHIVEYFHPRLEEICDTLPAALGAWALRTPPVRRFLGQFCRRGRHVTTTKLGGFLLLYTLASLRRWRRGTLRFKQENAKIEAWLDCVVEAASRDYDLAVEIARCQRLIKGYGDTYDRGWRAFSLLMARAPMTDAATLAAWRNAALADEDGTALRALLDGDPGSSLAA